MLVITSSDDFRVIPSIRFANSCWYCVTGSVYTEWYERWHHSHVTQIWSKGKNKSASHWLLPLGANASAKLWSDAAHHWHMSDLQPPTQRFLTLPSPRQQVGPGITVADIFNDALVFYSFVIRLKLIILLLMWFIFENTLFPLPFFTRRRN